ncbi:MAG: LbetaH domain-containing protein [Planctomycetota bacterium]|jgi:putative colanic acid biosynthesis acetyltransferase WcaF
MTERELHGTQIMRDSPFSLAHRLGRVAWGVVWLLLFRPSPRSFHGWRNRLLRLFGARIHPSARVYPRARCWAPWNLVMHERSCIADDVDVYCVMPITIGAYSTVSQYSYLCGATHDHEDPGHRLVPMPITIGRRCWIAADVFVAPGVTIGDGTVVGARSSVFRDLPEWTVAVGSPARPVRARVLRGEQGPSHDDLGPDPGGPPQTLQEKEQTT